MSNIDDASARPSDTTHREPPNDTLKSLQGEADFARDAITAKLGDLKDSLKTAADPREWAQQHPWIAVGIAAATGYAAVRAVSRKTNEPPYDPRASAQYANAFSAAPTGASTTWGALLFDLAKVVLTSQILPVVQAWMKPPNADSPDADPDSPAPVGNSEHHNGREA